MLTAQPYAPVVRSPGQEKRSSDDDKTDVGVDAVLSADVGDAPMRQRQYTAPIHAPSAKAPNAVRETLPAISRLLFSYHKTAGVPSPMGRL